jgi:hypothetical protein
MELHLKNKLVDGDYINPYTIMDVSPITITSEVLKYNYSDGLPREGAKFYNYISVPTNPEYEVKHLAISIHARRKDGEYTSMQYIADSEHYWNVLMLTPGLSGTETDLVIPYNSENYPLTKAIVQEAAMQWMPK